MTFSEYDVSFAADENFPIYGTLTIPDGTAPFAAVVMVHGSGATNRDEAVLVNAPFRDLAHGLAERGIASLRYDKRTFTHASSEPNLMEKLVKVVATIQGEVTDDAQAAVRLLRGDERIDGERIFVLGHSMGAGLAAYIGSKEPVAGYIAMAGTLKQLWEVIVDQNNAALAENPQLDTSEIRAQLDAEIENAKILKADPAQDADGTLLFGLPLKYLRSMAEIDAAALHLADGKPVLVLQGGCDKQVPVEYFEEWKTALAEHAAAKFVLYPALNHLFGEYTGEPKSIMQIMEEYAVRTPVPTEVIAEIAAFIR